MSSRSRQKSIYNQIVQSQYLELIGNNKLKENLASLYEHLNDRNESANLKLDQFNQEFDLALIDLVYYRTILNEVENSVDLDTSIKDYNISKGYRNNKLVIGNYNLYIFQYLHYFDKHNLLNLQFYILLQ